jgi:hypothetical protein
MRCPRTSKSARRLLSSSTSAFEPYHQAIDATGALAAVIGEVGWLTIQLFNATHELSIAMMLTQLRELRANSLLNLAPERKAALIDGAIGRKDTVKVINLVLKQLRQIAASPKRHNGSMGVAVADAYLKMPPDTYHEIWKREAIVPQLHHLFAAENDFRIYQRLRLTNIRENDAPMSVYLRCGDGTPELISQTKVRQSCRKVFNHLSGLR